jgi:hypothetical protein
MTTTLKLAEDLHALPLDLATQTMLVVGKRGSGKSNTCVRLAEQMHYAGIPFVAIDPVDNWWGVKASRNGKGPGLSVFVFGGRHADLPLEPTAGALMADVIVEHRISAVLSIKHFSGRERGRFVGDFAARLFQRNRLPLHVYLEEAHEVAPQQPMHGEEEMLGHVTRAVKLGRTSGLGVSAITQRPASLSKNITTQAEILIVHRTLGPQDVAAIREWIKYHGEREDILAQLSTLATGEAFIWAPDFPEGHPIGLKRIKVLMRETFDSAATPKTGEKIAEPKTLAPVDLEKLRGQMAATVEKAQADDPKLLRKRIVELEAEAKKRVPATPAAKLQTREIRIPVLTATLMQRFEVASKRALRAEELHAKASEQAAGAQGRVVAALEGLRSRIDEVRNNPRNNITSKLPIGPVPSGAARGWPTAPAVHDSASARSAPPRPTSAHERVPGGVAQRILNALAELEQLNARNPVRELVALLAGYSNLKSAGFVKAVGALRTDGQIDYPNADTVALTDAGRQHARPPERPRTSREIQERVVALIGGKAGEILAPLIEAYPSPMKRADVAARAGYGNLKSAGFVKAVGRLRTLGFLDYPDQATMVATSVLFLEGR